MKIKINKLFILVSLVFLISSPRAFSQGVVCTDLKDLDFGEVFLGYSSNVLHTDPGAAKYSFKQTLKRGSVFFSFNLPTSLSNNINTIPVTFNSSHSAWSKTDSPTGRTSFNPLSYLIINNLRANDVIYVWLGGTITAPSNVSAGVYQNSIIINVYYY